VFGERQNNEHATAVCGSVCEAGGGSGVAVNCTGVTSVSTPSVIPAPVAAVTTFPVQQQQQQPSLIDPGLLQQYSGNTLIHSFIHLDTQSSLQVQTHVAASSTTRLSKRCKELHFSQIAFYFDADVFFSQLLAMLRRLNCTAFYRSIR